MVLRAFDNQLPVELLPNDDQQLAAFVQRLFQPAYIDTFDKQIYACTALLLLSLLVGGSIVLHRVLAGQAWVLKLYRTPVGTFIIPNAMLAFLLVEGAFTALWIACMFVLLSYTQQGGYETSVFLWRQLIFAPLFIGGWFATWGTLSAFPDALRFKRSSNLHEFYLKPRTFNFCCWVLQLVPIFAIIAPTHLSQQAHSRAYSLYTSSFLSAAAGNDRRDIAIDIWREVTRAFWYLSITLTVWTIFVVFMLVIYTVISMHVIRRLSHQIRMAIRKHRNPETFFYFSPPLSRDPDKMSHSPAPAASRGFVISATGDASQSTNLLARRGEEQNTDQRAIWARKITNLRRIQRMLVIQFGLIEACMFMFVLAALWTAAIVYDNARSNSVGRQDSILWLVVAWSISIFGVALNVSILSRNHAPLLSMEGQEDSAEVRRVVLNPKSWFSSPRSAQQIQDSDIHEPQQSNRGSTHSAIQGDALPLFEIQSSSMDDTDKESEVSSEQSRKLKSWRASVRSWSVGHGPSTSRSPGLARARKQGRSEEEHDAPSNVADLPDASGSASSSMGLGESPEGRGRPHEPPTSPTVPGTALLRQALRNTPSSARADSLRTQPSAYGDWRRATTRTDGESAQEREPRSPASSRPGTSDAAERTALGGADALSDKRRPSSRPASSSSSAQAPRREGRRASAASTAADGVPRKTLGVRTVAKKLIADIDGDGEARDVAELPDAKLHFL